MFRFAAKAGLVAVLALGIGACAPRADGQTGVRVTPSASTPFGQYTYPGARPDDPSTFTTADAHQVRTIAGFATSDAFAKVYAYYRGRLPNASATMHVVSANGSVATFYVGGHGATEAMAVQISSDKPNVTDILLTRYSRRAALKSSERELMQ